MLRRYHPLWMSVHFIHPDELTPEVEQACSRLANAGIPLGSLDAAALRASTTARDPPETLPRPAPLPGQAALPLSGRSRRGHRAPPHRREQRPEIIEATCGHTTGYAAPTHAIDVPGGGGKIAILPAPSSSAKAITSCCATTRAACSASRSCAGMPLIGFTYDLRDDYLREGCTEEETAEFDAAETIDAIASGADVAGTFRRSHRRRVRNPVNRLSAGDRWDLVFNYAEGIASGSPARPRCRALLDAFQIPIRFPMVSSSRSPSTRA